MFPTSLLAPIVVLTTAATVIASQAVISGAFALVQQAIQLGALPRLDVKQTSDEAVGQVYVPQVNWLLAIAVLEPSSDSGAQTLLLMPTALRSLAIC